MSVAVPARTQQQRPPRENLVRAVAPGPQLRRSADGDSAMPTLVGYLARFNEWALIRSRIEGTFLERVAPTAFDKTFAENRSSMQCLFDHGEDPSIGKKILGPITVLESRAEGAWYEVELLDTSYNRDLLPGFEAGLYGSSFRFDAIQAEWVHRPKRSAHNPQGLPEQTLVELRVPEFGPVPFPAYSGTETATRSLTDEWLIHRLAHENESERDRSQISVSDLPESMTTPRATPHLFKRSARYVSDSAWVIHPAGLETIVGILAERAAGRDLTIEEIRARIGTQDSEDDLEEQSPVAVISLHGPIVPHGGMFTDISGATSVEGLRERFRAALGAEDVRAIVFDVDSPGGAVDLIPELADEIRASRGAKPIVAVANTWAASGAYWIASAADRLVVTPSGEVGSIGVITAHNDLTAKLAKDGVKTTELTAGKFKGELSAFRPLSDEAKSALQEKIDAYYDMFVRAVAKGRGVSADKVRSDFGEGRMVMAKTAVASGMADEIDTLEGVIARLSDPDSDRDSVRNQEHQGSEPEPSEATTRTADEPEPSEATTRGRHDYLTPREERESWRL